MSVPEPSPRRRGRPPRLHRDQIVAAALALVDEQGLEGFTTRALAVRLRADPTAIYRHFASKDDLLAALCDTVLAHLGPVRTGADWREEASRLAHRLHAVLGEHPGLVAALAAAPVTPATLAVTDQAFALLQTAGFPAPVARAGVETLYAYVLGFALAEHGGPTRPLERGEPPAADPQQAAALIWAQGPGDFALGLRIVLDGLAAQR